MGAVSWVMLFLDELGALFHIFFFFALRQTQSIEYLLSLYIRLPVQREGERENGNGLNEAASLPRGWSSHGVLILEK